MSKERKFVTVCDRGCSSALLLLLLLLLDVRTTNSLFSPIYFQVYTVICCLLSILAFKLTEGKNSIISTLFQLFLTCPFSMNNINDKIIRFTKEKVSIILSS